MEAWVTFIDRQRFFEMCYRFMKSLLLKQESAKIILGILIAGVGFEYLDEVHRGLIKSPQRLQSTCQIIVRLKVVGLDPQRLANEFDALFRLSCLNLADAQEVQRHGMLRHFLQHSAVRYQRIL